MADDGMSKLPLNGDLPPNGMYEQDALSPSDTATDTITLSSESPRHGVKKREVWTRKIDFLLACIGFSVGLGNVWRFPFLCYRNGGGAFLIPYFLAVILGGVPVFFLEVSLGQFMSEGGIGTWKICPLFQGIGYACAIIVFLLNCEYNIILTWAFYYLFSSFTLTLPWSHCDNDWNTLECTRDHRKVIMQNGSDVNTTMSNSTYDVIRSTVATLSAAGNETKSVAKAYVADPVTEFWERKVLHLSTGVDVPGSIKWDLCLCLLLAWIVVYFCIWKGIRSSGKVMYFTATSPYVLMVILLIRGLTLEGCLEGLKFYLIPDFARLLDPQVWVDAGTQIFFSYSISLGTLTALGSYNKFDHNVYKDAILFAVVNSFTSLLAGFVIFSILGYMAVRQGVSVADVAESGPGLAFIAYPEAVAQMPAAPLWSCLFFMMVILLGLDSQKEQVILEQLTKFIEHTADPTPVVCKRGLKIMEVHPVTMNWLACLYECTGKAFALNPVSAFAGGGHSVGFVGVEGFITFLTDLYPTVFRRGYRREILIGVVCAICFLIGLSMVTEGGMYVFQLFDYYSASRIVLVVAFFECVVVAYIYGINRMLDNLEMMMGFRVSIYVSICWRFLTPIFTMGIFVLGCITYSELTYDRKSVTYEYPQWAIAIGWSLASISVVCIPIVFAYRLWNAEGTFRERFMETTRPCLKKHQIRFGEDLLNINVIPENEFCEHEESAMNDIKSTVPLKGGKEPSSAV